MVVVSSEVSSVCDWKSGVAPWCYGAAGSVKSMFFWEAETKFIYRSQCYRLYRYIVHIFYHLECLD